MCGRAGRKGKDEAGETYLICVKADIQAVCDLLDTDMPAIESCLAPEKRGLKRYVSFLGFYSLTNTPQGTLGSHSNRLGIRLRRNQRIRTMHSPLPNRGQKARIHHHEICTPGIGR